MDNYFTSSSRIPLNLDNMNDVRRSFDNFNTANIDEFINAIKTMLRRYTAGKHKIDNPSTSSERTSNWNSLINGGATFLSFLDQQKKNFGESVDLSKSDGHVFGVISGILEAVGNTHWTLAALSMIGHLLTNTHWTLAALSMIGHLLTNIDQVSHNPDNCLQLLQYMLDLADHIKDLRPLVQNEEKLKNALVVIDKGSMLCAKQLNSTKLFRFLRSSMNKGNLERLRSDINVLYPELQLTAILPVRQPDYPDDAVGIEEREMKVHTRLRMDRKSVAFRAVVIYGPGGIGKSYLARAVYSKLNLQGYNQARVYLNIDPHKNDIKRMQEQILIDLFPNYSSGRQINLRDPDEGREELKRAFRSTVDKPVFLFIDNVLRAQDLQNLLPRGFEKPRNKHIRLLLTARELSTCTNMFDENSRREYRVEPLQNTDAKKILCKENRNPDRIKGDVDEMLKICGGFPLVLNIVGAHLQKQGYRADKCSQILDALKTEELIEEDRLSERMVDYVFKRFEKSTKEAFLDICCFFSGVRREVVEYSFGSTALKALEDAALITSKVEPEYYNETIVVHDVIKARGKNIARKTRISGIESFEQAVIEKRLHTIKGIDLYCDNSSYVLQKEHLDSMSKSLRVFILGTEISTTSKETFPELRYISSSGVIPCVAFHSGALPNLAVYRGPLPKHDRISKLPQSLRKITLFKCDKKCNRERSNPIQMALDSLHALKTLKLHKWQEIDELAGVIRGLGSLTTLILVECPLKCLPSGLGTLKHLELENCDKLHDCEGLVDLKALQFLNLKGCTSLRNLPSTFGKLKNLQHLNLRRCSSLEDVPGFEGLVGLKYLNVQLCPNLRRNFSKQPKGLRIER